MAFARNIFVLGHNLGSMAGYFDGAKSLTENVANTLRRLKPYNVPDGFSCAYRLILRIPNLTDQKNPYMFSTMLVSGFTDITYPQQVKELLDVDISSFNAELPLLVHPSKNNKVRFYPQQPSVYSRELEPLWVADKTIPNPLTAFLEQYLGKEQGR